MGLLYWSQSMVGSLLMRAHLVLITLAFLVVSPAIILAQESDSQESAQCTFEDGKQMVAHYNKLSVGKNDQPPMGKPWAPGGKAMTLFTEAEVSLSGKSIPTGGYTMWTIPGKKDWSLIVSKNTSAGSAYDGAQDIARAQMDGGMLPDGEKEFKVFFGHLGPKVCELNIVYGKVRAWVEFKEK
jgi:hypothetical protein